MLQCSRKEIIKSIKKADMFSKPAQLLIKKEENHKTLLGAASSLILLMFICILFYQNLDELLSFANPKSMTTEVYHPQPDSYKLDPKNFTLTFALKGPDYATYIDESIYVVDVVLRQKITRIQDGVSQDFWETKKIPCIPCQPESFQQDELRDYFKFLNLPTNYCLDWANIPDLSLEGTYDSSIFRVLQITLNVCTQETKRPQGPECKSAEEISAALRSNYFSMQFSSNTIDLKNPNKPHHPLGQDLFTIISNRMRKDISLYLQPLTTITDFDLLTSNDVTVKGLKYSKHVEMLDQIQGTDFLTLAIRLETVESVNYRSYPKIQEILGQLGGLWNILFVIAAILQKPLTNISYQLSIVNSLFNFQGESQSPSNRNRYLEYQSPNCLGISNQLSNSRMISRQAKNRLNSIILKNKQHEEFQDADKKQMISHAISNSIKLYFKLVSQKIRFSWREYLYFCKCCCKPNLTKERQIQFGIDKVKKQLDIIYIVKKLQEIDKLKMILLSTEQIQVFDYLPKPIITIDQKDQEGRQYFSILKSRKSSHQRAAEAQNAFQQLIVNPMNGINQKLIECMDQEMLELLLLKEGKECYPQFESINVEDAGIQFPTSNRCRFTHQVQ